MGAYKFAMYFNIQFGFLIEYNSSDSLRVYLPFLIICIGWGKDTSGYNFFNKFNTWGRK